MGEIKRIVETGVRELEDATGLKRAGVVGVSREGDGWRIRVEMVEKRSIPEGMDILGLYEVTLGADGGLQGFRRQGLRKRGDTDEVLSTGV